MQTLMTLEDLKDKVDGVYLAESVREEISHCASSITLWLYDDVLNITSTKEYNNSFNEKVNKICDIVNKDVIVNIYESMLEYNDINLKMNSLIGIFSRLKG